MVASAKSMLEAGITWEQRYDVFLCNAFPDIDFASAEVPVPTGLAKKMSLDNSTLPLDGLITLGLGVLCTLIYWAPAAMEQKFLISNGMLQTASWLQSFELLISSFFLLNNPVIAWALGMAS